MCPYRVRETPKRGILLLGRSGTVDNATGTSTIVSMSQVKGAPLDSASLAGGTLAGTHGCIVHQSQTSARNFLRGAALEDDSIMEEESVIAFKHRGERRPAPIAAIPKAKAALIVNAVRPKANKSTKRSPRTLQEKLLRKRVYGPLDRPPDAERDKALAHDKEAFFSPTKVPAKKHALKGATRQFIGNPCNGTAEFQGFAPNSDCYTVCVYICLVLDGGRS